MNIKHNLKVPRNLKKLNLTIKMLLNCSLVLAGSMGYANAELEQITVTAQKRSESLQEVPVSVNAFTGDMMKSLGVSDASDLVELTPGLSSNANAGSKKNYFLRGVGTNDFHLTAASAVGQYFDGITLTSGFHAKAALFDMERVEVLKGPQNTLFGLNTTGGAVNYITKNPGIGYGTEGTASLKLGNNNLVNAELAVGFDISDTMAGRIALYRNKEDGAFDSISDGKNYGDDDTTAFRGTFLYEPNTDATLTINMHGVDSKSNGTAVKAFGTRNPDGSGTVCVDFKNEILNFEDNNNCIGKAGGMTGEPASDPSTGEWEKTAQDIGFEDLSTLGFYVKFDYDLDWASFSSISSWDNLEVRAAGDNDGSGTLGLNTFQEDDRDTLQQEFRLISQGDEAYRWIAGLYYLYDNAESYTGVRGTGVQFGSGNLLPNVQLDHDKKNLGIYAQGEYDFSEALTLTVGLRWSDEKITGDYKPSSPNVTAFSTDANIFSNDINALVTAQGGFDPARMVSQKLENTDVGYTAKLDYKISPDSLTYLSYSKGFKGSALDIRAAYALVPVANVLTGLEQSRLEPESLKAWELGYKATAWNNNLQFDVAAFYYIYENLQQFITAAGVPTLDNAPESEIKGLDGSLKYTNDSGLFLQAGISLIDSEVTEDGDSAFFEGAELASTPELSYSLLASQEFELEGGDLITLIANMSYTGEQKEETATKDNALVSDITTRDDYTIFNATAIYRFGAEQQYSMSVYGKNLTNEHYCGAITNNEGGSVINDGITPTSLHYNVFCRVSNASTRTFGASFSMNF